MSEGGGWHCARLLCSAHATAFALPCAQARTLSRSLAPDCALGVPKLAVGILITASDGPNSGVLFTMFTVMQFFFGIGVGGEVRACGTGA